MLNIHRHVMSRNMCRSSAACPDRGCGHEKAAVTFLQVLKELNTNPKKPEWFQELNDPQEGSFMLGDAKGRSLIMAINAREKQICIYVIYHWKHRYSKLGEDRAVVMIAISNLNQLTKIAE